MQKRIKVWLGILMAGFVRMAERADNRAMLEKTWFLEQHPRMRLMLQWRLRNLGQM